jgi:RNA polymerase sigma factor (sigma-70 family)
VPVAALALLAEVLSERLHEEAGSDLRGLGSGDGMEVVPLHSHLRLRMTTPITLEETARRALDGDREALDTLVRAIQGDIYGLALRMLWNREDAEDATQEILIRIVTHLSQFGFRSRLKTWAYRVAVNYVLDVKKSAIERLHLSFERFAEDLESGLRPVSAADTEQSLLIEEVKVGCSLAMLQCLDRAHRAAYILGEIMEMPGPEAAEVLAISPDLFRKRLQHAREAVVAFTRSHCGLVSDAAPCQCHRRVSPAAASADGAQPVQFARRPTSFQEARALVRQVDEARRAREVHRSSTPRSSPIDFARRLLDTIDLRPDSTS